MGFDNKSFKTLIFLNRQSWENHIEFYLKNENSEDLNALRMAWNAFNLSLIKTAVGKARQIMTSKRTRMVHNA